MPHPLLALPLLLLLAYTPTLRADEVAQGDFVCGPRCVHYLVKYYDLEPVDLMDLVREMQFPDLASGATLFSLQSALTKRGLSASAVSFRSIENFDSDYPAIAHWQEPQQGHYVVVLGVDQEMKKVRFWNGFRGIQSRSIDQFDQAFSGRILLTAPSGSGIFNNGAGSSTEVLLVTILNATLLITILKSWKQPPSLGEDSC